MPRISSYALQYSNVDYPTILASTFDLFICEADADNSTFIVPNLSDAQVATLTAQGRTIAGYVNVAVTDANRAYWQDSWTSAGGYPRSNDDLNPVAPSAPSWLQSQPTNAYGIIVDFTESAWQTIVINQAVALVQRGYGGVFLDDVGAYYTLGSPGGTPAINLMANAMCQFVAAVKAAITAVNPNAYLVVNSDPYLPTNVTADATGAAAAASYLAAVDAHLLENQSATAINYAQTSLAGETLLILESDGSPAFSFFDSWARGILYTTSSYSTLGTFAYPATAGADSLSGGDGPNQINGLDGGDLLLGGSGNDVLTGSAGNDVMYGEGGADTSSGGVGDDTYVVDSTADVTIENAFEGNDTVLTQVSYALTTGASVETLSTTVHTGTSAIDLTGNYLDQTIIGNYGVNTITGGVGADVLIGLLGDDTYIVNGAGSSVIEDAGGGSDLVYTSITFVLGANSEVEILSSLSHAGTSAINLTGSSTAQTVVGNAGVNVLDGKGGNDLLAGLGGADTFAFTTALGAGNVDTLFDFSVTDDTIALDDAIFTAIGVALDAGEFVIGSGAADANDRIIYNSATGALFYDADGNGGGAAVQFATLTTGLALTSGDFVMI
ncbi:MAG TPA: hypothetical protein VMS43_06170 [Allosphingosinicella sp.]|nr:hypothetical protein [Allosphingosinicella sp.]